MFHFWLIALMISLQKCWLWPKTFHWTASSCTRGPYVCPLMSPGFREGQRKPDLITRPAAEPQITRTDLSRLLLCSQFLLHCIGSQWCFLQYKLVWVSEHLLSFSSKIFNSEEKCFCWAANLLPLITSYHVKRKKRL